MTVPSATEGYINPFHNSGARSWGDVPLQPWSRADHISRYTDIDQAERAFRDFRDALPLPRDVLEAGRLVLVSGHSGCGKSSVINRCAHWLQKEVAAGGGPFGHAEICDLTAERVVDGATDVRMQYVCRRLVSKLATTAQLSESRMGELKDLRDDMDQALPFLSDCLPDDTALIVLLPHIEVLEEMLRYWFAIRAKIVVFLETTYTEVARRCDQELSDSSEASMIHLEVGPLGKGDGRTFSKARTVGDAALGTGGVNFPALDLDAVDEMIERRQGIRMTPIRFIQRMLFRVYEEFRENPWPNGGVVTYAELTDCIVKWSRELG